MSFFDKIEDVTIVDMFEDADNYCNTSIAKLCCYNYKPTKVTKLTNGPKIGHAAPCTCNYY